MSTAGQDLIDARDGSRRYRALEVAHEGRSFEIARGIDLQNGNAPVALKGIRWPDDADDTVRRGRREASALEADVLRRGLPGLPGAGDLLMVQRDDGETAEPVVVHRWVEGETLGMVVARKHPDGMPLDEGLRVARKVADILDGLHEAGFVFRGLHPDHILITPDEDVVLVGTGNIGQRENRIEPAKAWGVPRWIAPETERELSGQFQTPRADVYSFGLLLAWMFSNRRPTGLPDAPITPEAWERVRQHPEGLALLIAHCTQPFHKKRFARMSRLLPLLHPDGLPTHQSDRFGEVWLLAPWKEGAAAGPGPIGSLSPGPLVSRPPSAGESQDASDARNDADDRDNAGMRTAPETRDDADTHEASTDKRPGPHPPDSPPLLAETPRARWLRLGFSGALVLLAVLATAMRVCS